MSSGYLDRSAPWYFPCLLAERRRNRVIEFSTDYNRFSLHPTPWTESGVIARMSPSLNRNIDRTMAWVLLRPTPQMDARRGTRTHSPTARPRPSKPILFSKLLPPSDPLSNCSGCQATTTRRAIPRPVSTSLAFHLHSARAIRTSSGKPRRS